MHDIRLIRDAPDNFDAGLARRGLAPQAATILSLDEQARAAIKQSEDVQAQSNAAAKSIGAAMAKGDTDLAEQLKADVARVKAQLPELEAKARDLSADLRSMLAALPNIPADDVPEGADESANKFLAETGTKPQLGFAAKEHDRLDPALGLDFETAAGVAGARFAYLRGGVAKLNRALGQFMLDLHTRDFGYEEVAPPLMVRDDAVFGTGQLPKFAEDLFKTTDGRWLIPTAEVSLTNMVREKILTEGELPLRLTALTQCFRSEAGSAGRDTRGFIRQHQFEKVELVSITTPDQSEAEHERMTEAAEAVLTRLGLHFRRMLLCAGDMGFTARKTYDLEVWLPGQNAYREISSCSNCGDFQARRMNARYRPDGEKGTRFVHTLNGSGLAVGRTLVAVLENYQQEDGSIAVPDVLQPYLGGLTVLRA
ncbi:MAG: serine--tRNA ligase [Chakrabartia sp.]